MRIEHIAVWVRDIERTRQFFETYFDALVSARYDNAQGFSSYFLTFPNGETRIEIMQRPLKIENLESRCAALSNQINPHFFFNSLNGISALVQRGNEDTTLDYIARLSDVFRYVLNSDGKQLVPLEEELQFVDSFAYVMQVRFGGKLQFHIDVTEEYRSMKLPVLSVLPLLENVSSHNRIDSKHPMVVKIYVGNNNLIVENCICHKTNAHETHGIGLSNLDNRLYLMTGNRIIVLCQNIITQHFGIKPKRPLIVGTNNGDMVQFINFHIFVIVLVRSRSISSMFSFAH